MHAYVRPSWAFLGPPRDYATYYSYTWSKILVEARENAKTQPKSRFKM